MPREARPLGAQALNSDPGTVAQEAAAALLELPQAQLNGSLPSLATYLAFDAPTVDPMPIMFFRAGSDEPRRDPDLLVRARRLAVGGRLLVARVRWLDEMVDSGKPLGAPAGVHSLAASVREKALSYFASCLGEDHQAEFLALLAGLEARHAVSLAIDAASGGMFRSGGGPVKVELESYAEQARARAMMASAPVEAHLMIVGASTEERRRARLCLGALAVAWQLGDDVLDLEEDYRDGGLSWIISETLRDLPEEGQPPGTDEFYEAALFGGHVRRALELSLTNYDEAVHAAGDLFPGAKAFAQTEIRRTTDMIADLTAITSSPMRG